MNTALTISLTYGAAVLGSLIALTLDATGRRSSGVAYAAAGLALGSIAGLTAGVMRTAQSSFAGVGVGGPASMVFGVVALVGAAAIIGGSDSLRERSHGGSIAALIALSAVCAGAAAAALDLVTVLLLLETMALAGYALVSLSDDARSAEAAMKYFVQGAVATGLFLFGMAVLIGVYAPSGQYSALTESLSGQPPSFAALGAAVLVLAGMAFKVGAVPFHSWAPDAYEVAPVPAAAYLASGAKLGAIGATSIFVTAVATSGTARNVLVVVAAISALSVLVGSITALAQVNYRRMLAYAGIAQAGYALVAVCLPIAPLAVFFASTYAIASAGTFLAADAFARVRPSWDGTVGGLAGLGRKSPILSGSLAVLFVSLAGLPPLLGFWAKLTVFGSGLSFGIAALEQSPVHGWAVITAVVVALVGSVISLGYYGAVLKSLYFESAPDAPADVATSSSSARTVAVLALLIIVLSVLPLVLGPTGLFEYFAAR
ncbi:MAG: hypothetical protein HGB10_00385 [Coriobacteriia bacterium]|nr:hypothetical protein [Coriobacteriia bacterium]